MGYEDKMRKAIFLFGEAEKGEFCLPYCCRSLEQLSDTFGHPPSESLGIFFAIQALLLQRDCIFFRVKEEGFSLDDYFRGLKLLEKESFLHPILAIALPGVGNEHLIQAIGGVCSQKKSSLILTEKDLYDYLTCAI